MAFLYKVFPFARLEKVTQFDAFKDASAEAKRLRAAADRPADCKLKVIFARKRVAGRGSPSRRFARAETGVVGE